MCDEVDSGSTAVVEVGGESFVVDKQLLAEQSEYFKAMFFTSKMTECGSQHVKLQDISPKDFASILQFVNTSELNLTSENIQPVYQAACMLHFPKIVQLCNEYLARNTDITSCLQIWWLVKSFAITDSDWIIKKARCMASTNFDELPIQECIYDLLYLVVADKAINVDESSVYRMIERWSKFQKDSCWQQCSNLLSSCIDWARINDEDLERILKSDFMTRFNELSSKLMAILQTRRRLCFACRLNLLGPRDVWNCARHDPDEKCQDVSDKDVWVELMNKGLRKSTQVSAFVASCRDTRKNFIKCFHGGKFVIFAEIPRSVIDVSRYVGFRLCSIGHYIFIFGGEKSYEGSGIWNRDIWRLDMCTNAWQNVGHMDIIRRHFFICTVGKCIYIIGGYGRFRVRLTSMSCLDTETYTWRNRQESIYIGNANDSDVVVVKKRIFVIYHDKTGAVISAYDTAKDLWIPQITEHNLLLSKSFNYNDQLMFVSRDAVVCLYDYDTRMVSSLIHAASLKNRAANVAVLCGGKLYEPIGCPANSDEDDEELGSAMLVSDMTTGLTMKYEFESGNRIMSGAFIITNYDTVP